MDREQRSRSLASPQNEAFSMKNAEFYLVLGLFSAFLPLFALLAFLVLQLGPAF